METYEDTNGTNGSAPRFATVVRGYDRLQVDDYVERLHQWIDQADARAQQCETAAARAAAEAERLRRRLASVDAGTLTATPESMKALGNRVGAIMQSSFQATKELHDRAEQAARNRAEEAEETARRVVAEATARSEELSRAAEELFVQAQQALDGASAAAAEQLEETRARGEAECEEMLERARNEVRELARRASAEDRSRREELAVLDEHRRRVLEEIGLFHQRLGSIGEGLSAARTPAPTTQPEPTEGSEAEPDELQAADGHDDETRVLELPPGSGTTRRKVSSSAR